MGGPAGSSSFSLHISSLTPFTFSPSASPRGERWPVLCHVEPPAGPFYSLPGAPFWGFRPTTAQKLGLNAAGPASHRSGGSLLDLGGMNRVQPGETERKQTSAETFHRDGVFQVFPPFPFCFKGQKFGFSAAAAGDANTLSILEASEILGFKCNIFILN